MTTATVIRWSPVDHAPELPLSAFNLIWSSSGSLILQGLYPTELNPPTKGIVLSFSNTYAFMSFDEFSDYLNGMKVEVPALVKPVPYGGCWPFLEVLGSPWLREVVERNGTLAVTDFRHWVIVARNHTLHVMEHSRSAPTFEGWLQ
ncbi:MAG: hypothetical protein A2792_09430 [Sphingomonadales bacterium RIFCSPHIGHO2_01_FULL_65_20]|jgi:hypothetical protein|uniref:hypothetical protein n=1 Tax=unclassified Blastomonas TaxID=2626550 RepID=UPI00082FA5AE|nr:hypothetical protein [Blastomonas sp.]OHC97656.1 MAG: hypothetical protein A2792_09430 [Sphingomonadales bacterium RIFCSPHIGHO2_01_FULL_65_20]